MTHLKLQKLQKAAHRLNVDVLLMSNITFL